jgi:hypothetical protein
MSESQYGVRIATSKGGNAYIAGLYGKDGVAQKLKAMGLERNEFQKWVKQAAIIVAQRATHLAPRDTGRLALSIRGFAGKKITPNNEPARYLFGGVIIAQPKVPGRSDTYAKRISFGKYNFRTGVRTPGNPYIRTARDQTRQAVVKMWNKEIGRWIERNGFETTGFGG